MIQLFEHLQFIFLRHFYPLDLAKATATPRLPLTDIFGDGFKKQVLGKTVVDFGCGHGGDVLQLKQIGAALSIGLDIRPELIEENQSRLGGPGIYFATQLTPDIAESADMVISVDAFEHYDDPAYILNEMHRCLRVGGEAWISFGPPWCHPRGGHLFSVFPWAHLVLSEAALIRWRSQYFHDGATRFSEVAGGLNQMTIKRFEEVVAKSPLKLIEVNCRPAWGLPIMQKLLGREFASSMVLAKLQK